jgi:transposase-like protein
MPKQRNHDSADFNAKVALAAMKGQHTVNELAASFGVHPNQVLQWKKQALEAIPDAFSARRVRESPDEET